MSAGIYGIIHDQITFTISPEYFTCLKFPQFGMEHLKLPVRIKVGIIGFLATWWMGLFLGIAYALISLFLNPETIFKITLRSILINLLITVVSGFSGYLYSILFLSPQHINWYIPNNIKDIQHYIQVGSIHNFGYIGGIAGLVAGITYQIRKSNVHFD